MAKYTIEKKLEILRYFENNGASKTCKVYNISNPTLSRWRFQHERGSMSRKKNKSYTTEEKLEIIKFYDENGPNETHRVHDISSSVIFNWKKKIEQGGIESLSIETRGRAKGSKSNTKNMSREEQLELENQKLRLENAYLKKLRALIDEENE